MNHCFRSKISIGVLHLQQTPTACWILLDFSSKPFFSRSFTTAFLASTIATTRPELLPACVTVAVHPNDERYQQYIGEGIIVPISERKVEIIDEDMVDPDFGTGVVMICTYGDKADVRCVAKHQLPVIICINEEGKLNENTGKYAGMTIVEARKAVVKDLEKNGLQKNLRGSNKRLGFVGDAKRLLKSWSENNGS